MRRLALGSLGGTLSMRVDAADVGIVPKVSAQMLAEVVPGLGRLAMVQTHTLGLSPSASLSWVDVLAARDWAGAMVDDGADGVVITQGTDTLEESAYLLDLLWPHPQPMVLTGAMRGADAAGADGPGNVLAAAIAALDPHTRMRGVVVAMQDRLYAADQVRKVHSLDLDAFQSPGKGCIGRVQEGQCSYEGSPPERLPALVPTRVHQRIAMLEAVLGEGPEVLHSVLEADARGWLWRPWARVMSRPVGLNPWRVPQCIVRHHRLAHRRRRDGTPHLWLCWQRNPPAAAGAADGGITVPT